MSAPPILLVVLGLLAGGGDASRAAAAGSAAPSAAALEVLAAGDLRGEIKPCGCSPEGQMGGLPRRLSYLEQALHGPAPRPILLDLGNNFPEASDQGRYKIDLIRTLLQRFPPDAELPGPGELALGPETLRDASTAAPPFVVSNAEGAPFPPRRGVERTVSGSARRIGIYGYLSPQATYQGAHEALRLDAVGPALLEALRRRIAAARDDASVLLFRGDDAELATFVQAGLFGLIVAGNPSADELKQITARPVAGSAVPQVPTKGQGLLRLALPTAGAPPAGGPQVDWLTERWPDHPDAAPAFAAYDAQVKSLFFARLETQQKHEQDSPYAGAAACAACHAPQQRIWAASLHSHALETLVRVGKQFDPECLACHVLGLQRGGYLSQDLTPQFASVQCENCHGPSRTHSANFKFKTGPAPSADGSALAHPAEQTCRTCHRGSHSPSFAFATYWPRIAHAGGSPAGQAAQR